MFRIVMKKIILFSLILFITRSASALDIIKPNVAGMFYPSDQDKLRQMVDDFIDKAEIKPIDGDIKLIICPHAGYIYSGGVAGYAYKAVKGKDFKTVVIIAPSHNTGFDGISIYESGIFRTLLGDIPVDEELAKKFIQYDKKIYFYPKAFQKEHSLEVELPFLKEALKDFKVVPMIFGYPSFENSKILGKALTDILKERSDVLVVVSTDMSHYHSYAEALKLDKQSIEKVKNLDFKGLFKALENGGCELCGSGGVIAGLIYCSDSGIETAEILKYANSGDVTGDKDAVVGYFSAVFYKAKKDNDAKSEKNIMPQNSELSAAQRKRLLEIARKSIESYVKDRKKIKLEETDPALSKIQGAFVTLNEGGELRGCIGQIEGAQPLYQAVSNMAIEAATGDPRFMPVTEKELSKIHIEISVLSPLEKVAGADKIILGKHGVIVRRGFRSGVFLPQVATQTNWSKEEFLGYLCAHKAGLPEDAWKDKNTELYVFTAEVFGEEK